MSGTLNQANYQTVWNDNFAQNASIDTGIFPLRWGNGGEFSFNGGLTLTSDGTNAGFLTQDGYGSASMGYGLFQATISVPSNTQQPSAAVLLWPASNQWPGPEIDLVEQLKGQAYMTVHWQGSNGGDQYQSYFLPNVDLTQKTTVAMDWQNGSLTYYVNGQQVVQYTSGGSVPVPADAAHGAQNEAFGAQVGSAYGTQLTVYDMSYSQYTGSGGSSSSSSSSSSSPSPAPSAAPAQITAANTNTPAATNFASSGATGDSSAYYGQHLATSAGTDILHGGHGLDTFAVAAGGSDGWAEVTNFHSGDVLSILGFIPGQSSITWTTATDPNGQTGATANISVAGNGHTDMAITFAGVSQSDAQNFGSGNWHAAGGTPELNLWRF